uniref:RNase H type-1 domain-containing protein n=1 Tax=Aegilops tauschii subsp. strangulata TaxID=200361 RepID=A0A452Y729_AEGTS
MRKEWRLPEEKEFWYTGTNWLQILLDKYDSEIRKKILLLLWRTWFLRDNCVHSDGKETISRPVMFLVQYEEEIRNLSLSAVGQGNKSCWSLSASGHTTPRNQPNVEPNAQRKEPSEGVVKLNTDAAFLSGTGQAWASAIARDHTGHVVFSASKSMNKCR